MKCFVFWTAGKGRASRIIQRVTRIQRKSLAETPSHAGILFLDYIDNGDVVYEAHIDTGGWRMSHLKSLKDSCEKRGKTVWHAEISDQIAMVTRVYARCWNQLGIWHYNKKQLPLMMLTRRMNSMTHSPNQVVCSECPSRVLAPWWDIPDLCGYGPYEHDKVNPAILMEHFPKPVHKGWPQASRDLHRR
jgi:hypothetical protein